MRHTGFTLTELLVVIVITAMLIAVLVPVLHTIRQQTRAVVCGSNLKRLSVALTVYERQNGTFPHGFDDLTYGMVEPPGGYPGDAAFDLQGWWWFHFLEENLGKGSILWCPSRNVRGFRLKGNILCGNYGVNRAICSDAAGPADSEFVGTPLGLDEIRNPAETLLITDSGYSLISWLGATNAPGRPFENARREGAFYVPGLRINKERTLSPGFERDAVDGRHPDKMVNVAFADGHVARLRADDLFVEETGGNYSNRSPLWLPE